MKVEFGLALLCCFIGGMVVAGCDCDLGVKDCFCIHDYVIKATVKDDGKPVKGTMEYSIKEKKDFKEPSNFEFVRVPDACNRTLHKGTTYLFMGKMKTNTIMKVKASDGLGLIKKWEFLNQGQIDYLKDEDEQDDNCEDED